MALDYFIFPDKAIFDNTPVGQTEDKTVVISVTGSGGGHITFSAFSGLSAPFSLPNGETSIPLALDETYDLVIRFTPIEKTLSTGTLHIDASGLDSSDIICSGAGGIITQHSLPDIDNLACGKVKCYIFEDGTVPDFADLLPESVKFLDLGEIRESIDLETGVTDIDQVDVTVAEDYTKCTEGFWHRIINTYPTATIEIMFTIMESTNETFLFRGQMYRQDVYTEEYYLDKIDGSTPTKWVRGVKFKLTSSLQLLQNVTIADLITECTLHTIFIFAYLVEVVPYRSIVASIIRLAYGIPYDDALCVNNSSDIRPRNTDGSIVNNWDEAALVVKADSLFVGFFLSDTGNSIGWYNRYANAYDLLKDICFKFGVIPRYQYGTVDGLIDATPANNSHRLIFNSRGNAVSSVTMTNDFDESNFVSDSSRKAKTIRITDTIQRSQEIQCQYWFLNNVLTEIEAPPFAKFDIDGEIDILITSVSAPFSMTGLILYDSISALYVGAATTVDWWRYSDGSRQVTSGDYLVSCLARSLVQYLFYRFQKGRLEYTRLYESLKANDGSTDSQRWNRTLVGHAINDGVTARTFYATEVSKNVLTNKSKVVWVED
jgi:hypothetical protein